MMQKGDYGAMEDEGGHKEGSAAPRGKRPGVGAQLDRWLKSDLSSRNVFGSMAAPERLGLLNKYMKNSHHLQSDAIFGPTDRTIEAMVRCNDRPSKYYKSMDRGLVDTTVWHRRKAALLMECSMKMEGKDPAGLPIKSEDSFGDGTGSKYKYDAEAVSRLQHERWLFDKVLIIGIGVSMAVVGLAVSKTADNILDKKIEMALERFENHGFMTGMMVYVGISALLGLCAFLPVACCPVSAGSGIAEAKATLNGVIIPNCTSLVTALCKGISVIMSVSASLPAGLEGPMIHLGLCLGENANRLVPRKCQVLDSLRSERSRIDYTAVGTAAGVSAAFRAPIAGILFAMEEGASFWSTHLTWRCFLSACVTVVAMYSIISSTQIADFHIVSMDLFNGVEQQSAIIPSGFVPQFKLWEYSLFAAVGAAGGLLGALFIKTNRAIAVTRRKMAMGPFLKCLEVLLVVIFYAALTWILPLLPVLTKCVDVGERRMNEANYRQYNCPEGQYNELATLFLNLGGKGITMLFQEDGVEAFSIAACVTAGLVNVVILCFSFGISVSAGIFIPLLFIGACLGRGFALAIGLDPRTYAIVGAAACLGGVVRVLISLTVIVTSTTSLGFFITPIMLTTLMAQMVGNKVSGRPGIYDVILQLRDVPFLEEEPPEGLRHTNLRARNIMKTGLVKLTTHLRVGELVGVLRAHSFSDFPVVDKQEGTLVGSISRVDLIALLNWPGVFVSDQEGSDDDSVTDLILSFSDLDKARQVPLPGKEDIGKHLSLEDEDKYLHLSPYINIAPHTIRGHGAANRAYEMFRCLGLRSLYVIDKSSHPLGVITRHELILLEEIGGDHHKIEKILKQSCAYMGKSAMTNQFE